MKRQDLFRSATALALSALMAVSPLASAGPVSADTGTESVSAVSSAPDEMQDAAETTAVDTAETSSADVTVTSDTGKLAEETAALDGDNRLIIRTDEDLAGVLTAGEAVQMDDVAVASFGSAEEKEKAKDDLAEAGIGDVSEDETVTVQDGASAAAGTVQNGTGKKIALIDTGVNGIETVDFTGEGTADDNGHGTKMAQAIEEAAGGKADILSLKAIGKDGSGSLSNVYAAVKYAMENDAEIINLSFNVKDSDKTSEVKGLIEEAIADGITVVAAAGNQGSDASIYFPGNIDGVFTAGASMGGKALSSSNKGDCVDYYVDATATSIAAAKLSGFLAVTADEDLASIDTVYTKEEMAEKTSTKDEGTTSEEKGSEEGNEEQTGGENEVIDIDGEKVYAEALDDESLKLEDGKVYVQISTSSNTIFNGESWGRGAEFMPKQHNGQNTVPSFHFSQYHVVDSKEGTYTWCIEPHIDTQGASESVNVFDVRNETCTLQLGAKPYTYTLEINPTFLKKAAIARYWFENSSETAPASHLAFQVYIWQYIMQGQTWATPDNCWYPATINEMGGQAQVSPESMKAVVTKINDEIQNHYNLYTLDEAYLIANRGYGNSLAAACGKHVPDGAHTQRTFYVRASYHPTAPLSIHKQTATGYESIVAGNPCYSLKGARYHITGNGVDTYLTTNNENGDTDSIEVNEGDYTVTEVQASPGYQLDTTPHTVHVNAGVPAVFTSSEIPKSDPANVTVVKKDTLGNDTDTDLSGTEFTFRYYLPVSADTYVNPANVAGRTPAKTWTVGVEKLKEAPYYAATLAKTGYAKDNIPYGTLTIEETKQADGMLLTNKTMTVNGKGQNGAVVFLQYRRDGSPDDGTYDIKVTEDGSVSEVLTGYDYKQPDIGTELVNEAFRTPDHVGDDSGDYHFVDTIQYEDAAAGESYTFKGTLVNKKTGDAIPLVGKDGKPVDAAEKTVTIPGDKGTYVNGEVKLDFYVKNSDMAGVSAVAMEEMWWNYTETSTGEKKSDKVAEHKDRNDDAQTVNTPGVSTEAVDEKTGDHVGEKNEEMVKIVDRVDLTNLRKGQTYTVKGVLMEKVPKEEPKPAEDKDTAADDTKDDASAEDGKSDTKADDTKSDDAKADDAGDAADGTDTKDEEPKAIEYVEKPFLDDAGNEVKAELTFKADDKDVQGYKAEGESVDGYVELTFEVPKSRLDGRTAVVFEDVYHQGVHVAKHHDIDSEDQSVHYPAVRTEAVDKDTKDHVGTSKKDEAVVDTIYLENLVKGQTYKVAGVLMDRDTGEVIPQVDEDGKPVVNDDGEALPYTAEKTFVANETDLADYKEAGTKANEAASVSGHVELEFTVDSTVIEQHTIVVYEELYHKSVIEDKDGSKPDVLVGKHRDIKDEAQSVHVPHIYTTAVDKETGTHNGTTGEEATIVDTVHYFNLVPGLEYKVTGTLMVQPHRLTDEEWEKASADLERDGFEKQDDGSYRKHMDTTEDGTKIYSVRTKDGNFQYREAADGTVTKDKVYSAPVTVTDKDGKETQETVSVSMASDARDEDVQAALQAEADKLIEGQEGSAVKLGEVTSADKPDYEPAPLTDKDGKPVTEEVTFTPDKADGTVDVVFAVDSTLLHDVTVVAYEGLWHNGIEVCFHRDINDQEQSVHYPAIGTILLDSQTKDHLASVKGETTLVDTVEYKNLLPDTTYTMNGRLMVKAPKAEDGMVRKTVTLTIGEEDLAAARKAAAEAAKEAAEDADKAEGADDKDAEAAGTDDKDTDTKDTGSTRVSTADDAGNAADTADTKDKADADGKDAEQAGTKTYDFTVNVVVKEDASEEDIKTAAIEALKAEGEDLTASADKAAAAAEDGPVYEAQELKIDDRPVLGETTFTTPADDDGDGRVSGTVEVTFTYDATKADGMKLVAFEDLYDENSVWMDEHKDVYDDDQSIDVPKVETNASDKDTNSHVGSVKKEAVITDLVTYDHLIAGKEYTVKGTLMDKESKAAVKDASGKEVTFEVTFTAEKSAGTVEMTFKLDSTLVEGKAVVVFEDLYYTGVKVYSHADIEDEDQTIHYPKIETNAKINRGKSAVGKGRVTVVDEVTYHDLIPGVEYTLEGVLMDKASNTALSVNGQPVRVTASFRPDKAEGRQDITFSFDATGLRGSYVAFETLYHKESGKEVAEHKDINDQAQTVTFVRPGEKVQTGDTPVWPFAAAGCVALAAAVAVFILHKKKKGIPE